MLLFLHSIAHLLVDAVCAAALFGPLRGPDEEFTRLILLYNTLAFSTQCLVGLAADRLGKDRFLAPAGMLTVVLGFALPLPAVLRVILIGLGNSAFHVGGGIETLRSGRGKAAHLGVFVAPGAIGLTLGTLYPACGPLAAALLALTAAALLWTKPAERAPEASPAVPAEPVRSRRLEAAIVLLTAAVAVRAVGGAGVSYPWKTAPIHAALITLFVFAGKTAGGFVCDRLGPSRSAWLSIPLAAALITFCAGWMIPSLLGQFALNLTMPITLWLLFRAMPDSPGFAFGLAASALWPGTIAGQAISLTGSARWILLLTCFLFGLLAVLYAVSALKRSNDRKESSQ